MDRLLDGLELPWPSYHAHLKLALGRITVSFKPDHSYEGAMHEAGANRLKPSTILMGQKNSKGKDLYALEKLAIENLIQIRSTSNLTRHFAGTRNQKQFTDENGNTIAYKGYVGGNNDCIEIWVDENGDWVGDVIRTWDAYQTVRELGQVEGFKKLRHPTKTQRGKPLLMRLIGNDAVRMTVNGAKRVMRFISVGATSGQMVFAPHNESNVAARNADKSDSFKYTTKYASSLQKTLARKVTVNELGKVLDNGFQAN
jgi:CRISPR-associated endonuclease Csn1